MEPVASGLDFFRFLDYATLVEISPHISLVFRSILVGAGGDMTNSNHSPDVTVVSAKQMILNKLCTASIRFEDDGLIPADELRRELDIPETVFAEALESF